MMLAVLGSAIAAMVEIKDGPSFEEIKRHAEDFARVRDCIFDGAQLTDQHGKHVTCGQLSGRAVALYFAGEWCPLCRRFTPALKKFYKLHGENVNPYCDVVEHVPFHSSAIANASSSSHKRTCVCVCVCNPCVACRSRSSSSAPTTRRRMRRNTLGTRKARAVLGG